MGLIHAETGQLIDPIALISDPKLGMSDWELHDFFVQVVRDYIAEKLGRQLISSQGNPHVDPSIWFVGDNVPEWVVVRAVKIPDKEAMFSSNLSAIAASCARMSTVLDRRLLTTRPAQNPTQLGVHAGQRRRQGLPDSTKPARRASDAARPVLATFTALHSRAFSLCCRRIAVF